MTQMRLALRVALAVFMVSAGGMHFLAPQSFIRIVPTLFPAPARLVFFSGVLEIFGGVGLLVPFSKRWAAWGLIGLYVAMFPANVHMAVNQIGFERTPGAAWMRWARLPLQALLIGWAYWSTR